MTAILFPAAVLFITVNPTAVDVNVHPSKLEIKFSSDRPVFDAVYYAVKTCTSSGQRPEYRFVEQKKTVSSFVPVTDEYTRTEVTQLTAFDTKAEGKEMKRTEFHSPAFLQDKKPENHIYTSPLYQPPAEKEPEIRDEPGQDKYRYGRPNGQWRYVGEVFDTYLFVEDGDDVLVIDKHAAHERLRFEELKAAMRTHTPTSQMRMIPITVPVTEEEADAAEQYRQELTDTGYGFERSEDGIDITQTPANISDDEAKDLFIGMLSELCENGAAPEIQKQTLFERALYQVCCKGAIKGGDKNDEDALLALIAELYEHPEVTYCPHGRPVAFKMTKAAMERRFGRT